MPEFSLCSTSALRLSAYRDLILALDGLTPIRERNIVRTEKKTLEKEKKGNLAKWNEEKQRLLAIATKRETFLKDQIRNLLRNALPDEQIVWLDAVVAVGSDKPFFAPLLGGTGGVEGSMDIGVNFMDNLLFLLEHNEPSGPATLDSQAWLGHALHGTSTHLTAKNTAGSLAPNRVGGPNATTGFSRKLYSNHPPAKPGAFIREPLEAATGSLTRPRGSWAA